MKIHSYRLWLGVTFSLALVASCTIARAAELTATWDPNTGPQDESYDLAANWDINQTPVNDLTDQYNVVIPSGFTVQFDVDAPAEINDFTLAANASFLVPGGHSLTVLDDTSIAGTITADSTSALFQATGAGAAFAPSGAKLFATGGGTVRVAASSYVNNTFAGTTTLLFADGTGSELDLVTLLTYSDTRNSNGTRIVSASNNGVIDLSNVGSVTKTGGGTIEFEVDSGGQIDLSSLATVSGSTLFDVNNASYTLPSLTTATGMIVDLANGSTFTANTLSDLISSTITFDGDNPGVFQASSLNNISGSTVAMTAGQQLNLDPNGLTDINSARIMLRGGVQFGSTQIVTTTYTNSVLGGTGVQFSADGSGTELDLSSLLSYSDTRNSNGTRIVSASNNGVIDLSNVGSVTKTGGGTIEFEVDGGGQIDLSSLATVSGSTRFDINNASYTLPSLTTATGMIVDLANGSTFTANTLSDLISSTITFDGDNPGVFQASSLNNISGSTVAMTAGQQLNLDPNGLTDINSARIMLRGGVQFGSTQIVTTTYTNSVLGGTGVQFSADGSGTELDLSSLLSYSDTRNSNGTRIVSASNNGVIDLSNVGSVTKTGGGTIEFEVDGGGQIDLSSLATVSGSTRFDINNASYTLPSLTTATGMIVDLANGSTFTANTLSDLISSTITFDGDNPGVFQASSLNNISGSTVAMTAGQQLNLDPNGLTDINSARIMLRGGVQFGSTQIVTTTYTNSVLGGTGVQFSADGSGTELDLSSLLSYSDTRNSNGTRIVSASNNGVIDLSNVGSVTKTGGGTIEMRAETGGKLLFESLNTAGSVRIEADGTQSRIEVTDGINLDSPSVLELTDGGTLRLGGDFIFSTTNEAQMNLDAGIVDIVDAQSTFLEAGGEDLGVGGDPTNNFGIGKLVIGEAGNPTMTFVTDLVNNGNRGGIGGSKEALYLLGFGGPDGLELVDGSMLILGDINAYALVDGSMVHLNSLFSVGVHQVPFSGGSISDSFPGDFDFDSDVDNDDLTIWETNYGTSSGALYANGDADKDGDVDGQDFLIWQRFAGSSIAPLSASSATVPEPGSLLLVILASLAGIPSCRLPFSRKT